VNRSAPACGALACSAQLGPADTLDYDSGVKKPVAVPKRWSVPNGKEKVTSKPQVTRSPWTWGFEEVSVSVSVSVVPAVGELERDVECLRNEDRRAFHETSVSAQVQTTPALDNERARFARRSGSAAS
jgi:hypothetical protein